MESPFRSGYVAIVGEPNVGKSTLMNRLLQERLAIVTARPQTTRRRTLGILSGTGYQMVLLDTPGLMDPRYELHHAMLRQAHDALREADLILYLADPSARVRVPEAVRDATAPRVLALNKIDRLSPREAMLPLLQRWQETGLFGEMVPISALDGTGVDELRTVLLSLLPEGPPFFPPDQITDQSERFFVAEMIRERIFELYGEEIPYATEVLVDEFKERPEAKDFIEASVFVEQESQKGILIGKEGSAIRRLGEEAREEIEAFLGRPVFLSLRVRVLPKWRRREEALRRLGHRK
jgi:GTPase